MLTPGSLSRRAVGDLVGRLGEGMPAASFVDACYEATRGNPFLLHELLVEIEAAGLVPSDAGAREITGLGSGRVAEGALARVRRLGEDAVRLTRSLAVLGDRVPVAHAIALSGLDGERVEAAAAALVDAGVLVEGFPLEFAHPLVRSAVYEHLPYAERLAAHERAARMLARAGARAEGLAAHLLILAPREERWVVDVLRRAARDAARQGWPRDAVEFLRRALAEPPAESVRGVVLAELGVCEHDAEDAAAVEHLSRALELTDVPAERARIGLVLARAIWHEYRIVEAVALLDRLIGELDEELAAPLEAELIAIARLDPRTRRAGLRALARAADAAEMKDGPAQGLLLANLCFERAVAGATVAEAVAALGRRALADGLLLEREGSENTIYHLAAWALGQCDRFAEAESALQAAIALARREGSVAGFARALTFRANLCYRRGLLEEAEADATQALEHLTSIRAPLTAAFLLDVLIERGQLRAAEGLLERFGLSGDLPDSILHTIALERRGRLRMARGDARAAAADLLLCGERAVEWGAGSPAFLAWRSSAALALAQIGRGSEAIELAEEEVQRASALAAPRALGVALRVQGLLSPRPRDLGLLERAADVLQDSGAALEYARTLVDLGAALRRAGQRVIARAAAGGGGARPAVSREGARAAGEGRAAWRGRPPDPSRSQRP